MVMKVAFVCIGHLKPVREYTPSESLLRAVSDALAKQTATQHHVQHDRL